MSNLLDKKLDQLFVRFILNAPQENKFSHFRVCYELEMAFWFYLDFCKKKHPELPKLTLEGFMKLMFDRFPNKDLPRPKNKNAREIRCWFVFAFYVLKLCLKF